VIQVLGEGISRNLREIQGGERCMGEVRKGKG
jgi:hypothetical protein